MPENAIECCGVTPLIKIMVAETKRLLVEKSILKIAKEQFHLKRIVAITRPTNLNSIKLLEKLGLIFEKMIKPFEEDEELLLFAIKL